MDHHISGRRLRRNAVQRKALINGLLTDLFRYQRITTTLAKAKELKRHADKLVTQALKGTMHNRRMVFKRIKDESVIKNLFDNIAPRFEDRPGGYTRVLKMPGRLGDNAPMAIIELVDIPDEEEIRKVRKKRKRPVSLKKQKRAYPGKNAKKS